MATSKANIRSFLTTIVAALLLNFITTGCTSAPEQLKPTSVGFAPVTGGNVYYEIYGGDRPGIPLLVLHGGPGIPHDYMLALRNMADERPVIFYDQLGCGNSDRPDDENLWTIEHYVEELRRVRDALHLRQVHLLGHSWGSMLAVDYMLREKPEGVVSLTLAGPSLSMSRWVADQRKWLSEFPEDMQETVKRCEAEGDFDSEDYQNAIMQYYAQHVCRLEPWPKEVQDALSPEKMGEDVYVSMCGQSEFTITGTLKTYERVDRLREIKGVPTLFTCGRYDEARPETTAYYHKNMPGSEIAVIEDASHLHFAEQPDAYKRVLSDFLHRAEEKSRANP